MVLPDLLLPLSRKVVGPSASILFQGGETGLGRRGCLLGGGVPSLVRRRLAGLPSSSAATAASADGWLPFTWLEFVFVFVFVFAGVEFKFKFGAA